MSLEYLDININKSIYPHNILLLSGASAPRFVAACLEVSVEVGPVDQGVDAAAEGGRQQHEVRHKEHSPEGVPVSAMVNFRFGIFSSEPPKDL